MLGTTHPQYEKSVPPSRIVNLGRLLLCATVWNRRLGRVWIIRRDVVPNFVKIVLRMRMKGILGQKPVYANRIRTDLLTGLLN